MSTENLFIHTPLWITYLSSLAKITAFCLLVATPVAGRAEQGAPDAEPLARVMLLGLFHFDNPGLDAVKYEPVDVMKPEQQMYQRYSDYLAGRFELDRNEMYQLGFRVARLMGHPRVHGIDAKAPPVELMLWGYLSEQPEGLGRLEQMIAAESERLQRMHRALTLREILSMTNSAEEDQRNKGFYILLNPVGADGGLFHGADASADWWHRNLRMYALIQAHAQPGERVLVIAGSGHTAILRDFLRADGARLEEEVLPYL